MTDWEISYLMSAKTLVNNPNIMPTIARDHNILHEVFKYICVALARFLWFKTLSRHHSSFYKHRICKTLYNKLYYTFRTQRPINGFNLRRAIHSLKKNLKFSESRHTSYRLKHLDLCYQSLLWLHEAVNHTRSLIHPALILRPFLLLCVLTPLSNLRHISICTLSFSV